ncbi:MAG: hypothetical protein SF052_17185 [Bacteroidia bacterium]|nr:hypothetical protein [Bacteroidia bacterium]
MEEIKKLVETHTQLAQQAREQYKQRVDHIITTQTKDVNHICYTLDFMLDFCFDDKILLLYRRLCRYLWDIDPVATASYINYYRERWDEEGTQFGNAKTEVI